MQNQYLKTVVDLIGDLQGWGLTLIAGITVAVIVFDAIHYQQGGSSEKAEAIANIKNHFKMGAGVFFLVWFAGQVVNTMSKVQQV